MIHITIDPSMLTGVTNNSDCELTVNLAGCSWDKSSGDDPVFTSQDALMHTLYPWYWKSPVSIDVIWLKEFLDDEVKKYQKVGEDRLGVINFDLSKFDNDKIKIQQQYESILNNKIIKSSDSNPIEINENEILKDTNSGLKIDFNIDDDEQNVYAATNFLTTSIGQFAQKLRPISAAIDLTYFARGESLAHIPEFAPTHYIVYPIGDQESENWSKYTHFWCKDKEYIVPAGNDGEPIPPLVIAPDDFSITYTNPNGDVTFLKLFCPITPVPSNDTFQESMVGTHLRDKEGDFLGHTNLEVYDSDELFDKTEFKEKLVQRISAIFDLPGLLYEFLEKNKESIEKIEIDDLTRWGEKINQLLTILLRDTFSIGNALNSKVTEMILGGESLDSSNGLLDRYNSRIQSDSEHIELIASDVIHAFVDFDKMITAEEWREVLRSTTSLNQKLEEIEKYVLTNDKESINKWLSLWRTVVNNQASANNSDSQTLILSSKRDLLKIQIIYVLKKSLITGSDERSERSRKLFVEVVDKYFEHYNPSNLFIESIAININGNSRDTQFQSNNVTTIRDTLTNICKDYIGQRRLGDRLFPSIANVVNDIESLPFPDNTKVFWPAFIEFGKANDFMDGVISVDLEKQIAKLLTKSTDIPPNVLFKVDGVDAGDDLCEEITGYLLFMQRAKQMHRSDPEEFDEVEWKGLNWTRIDLLTRNNLDQIDALSLENDYLIPSFLPETDHFKTVFLTLSNERLSLVAGHDLYDDIDDSTSQSLSILQSQYLFENRLGSLPPGYSLWYGYCYQFAGFVALNTGVLPKAIREHENDWITPRRGITELKTELKEAYKHLRRVPFSKVFCDISRDDKRDLIPVPSGLQTIANELNEIKDLPVYLLFDNKNGSHQTPLKIELGKPLTNFWNWYAWNGNGLNQDKLNTVLTEELAVRGNPNHKNEYLHDPALENKLQIIVDQVFPAPKREGDRILDLEAEFVDDGLTKIRNNFISVKISATNSVKITEKDKTIEIEIPEGMVVKIAVRCLTNKEYFDAGTNRFHAWMTEILDSKTTILMDGEVYYLTRPVEMIFEAAIKPANQITGLQCWNSLLPFETEQRQIALDLVKQHSEFAYFSRTVVEHQVWHWNGRLSTDLLGEADADKVLSFPDGINAEDGDETTYAMKWEAWEFSDRPDFSALQYTTNLRASLSKNEIQTIFTDTKRVDEKAMYYRFSTELFGRYELLGGIYTGSVRSTISIKDKNKVSEDKWKRYFKPSRRTVRLPKPVVRFVIPLTESVDECHGSNEIRSASLMIVLNDRWFSDSGLAEKCEVGVEILDYKGSHYLNASPDAILSRKGLSAINIDGSNNNDYYIELPEDDPNTIEKENPIAVFRPEGPAGLTYDFATPTPKLKGSTFILKVNDINRFSKKDQLTNTAKDPQLTPWPMVQIAVRRNIEKSFWENATFYSRIREFCRLRSEDLDSEKVKISVEFFLEDERNVFEKELVSLWEHLNKQEVEEYRKSLDTIRNLYKSSPKANEVGARTLAGIKSEWAAKEWVQFVPDTNSLLPIDWRKELTTYGAVAFRKPKNEAEGLALTYERNWRGFPVIDSQFVKNSDNDDFNRRTERYLVVSEETQNAGGQPVEKYLVTFRFDGANGFEINDSLDQELSLKYVDKGYARLITVRVQPDDKSNVSLWEKLFGTNRSEAVQFSDVQNDPTAALPLISKRFAITLED